MPTPAQRDLWHETYQHLHLKDARNVGIITAIHSTPGPARLTAELQIETLGLNTLFAKVGYTLTPAQMRELAGLLTAAADRIDTELQPLLDQLTKPAHKVILTVQQTTEPPVSLYAEPEVI